MSMHLSKHLNIRNVIFILLSVSIASLAILWDLQRLNNNFDRLYSLLKTARWDAKDTILSVKFNGDIVTDQ